jgi:hypothetical protein
LLTSYLESWVLSELNDLAQQFDAHNGNTSFSQRISGDEAVLQKYNTPFVSPEPVVQKKPKKQSKLEQG